MRILLVVLAAMLAASGWGQILGVAQPGSVASTWRTGGSWNGRLWKTLGANEHIIFLAAYSDAVQQVTISTTEDFQHFSKLSDAFWPRGLGTTEVCAALDVFYGTPENTLISIANAIQVIALRSSGTDEPAVQQVIADLRARASR